jgi:hypothetical protein
MGGGLLEWRWGRTANQQTGGGGGNKKEKTTSRKKSTRRVRFKEGSSGALRIGDAGSGAAPGGGGVVQGKEKKRVWFSRIWLSIRRKEGRGARRQTAPEKGIELPSEYSDIVFITVSFTRVPSFQVSIPILFITVSQLPRSSSFTTVSSCQVSIPILFITVSQLYRGQVPLQGSESTMFLARTFFRVE